MTESIKDEYLTAGQLAKLVGIHHVTAWKRLERGELPATKFGNTWMIKRSDALRYKKAFEILEELRAEAQRTTQA